MSLFTPTMTPQALYAKLVEAESEIGGDLLPKPAGVIKQRFWYHKGDWFYETQDATGTMVARYQFLDGKAHKLVGGKPVAFAEGEIKNLRKIIQMYHDRVYEELYAPRTDRNLTA